MHTHMQTHTQTHTQSEIKPVKLTLQLSSTYGGRGMCFGTQSGERGVIRPGLTDFARIRRRAKEAIEKSIYKL